MQSIGEKVATAKDYKEKGNEFFKANLLKKAVVAYSTGIAYIKGLPGRTNGLEGVSSMAMNGLKDVEKITPEVGKEVDELECILKTNLATCYIKLENSAKALQSAKDALDLNPHYWKASLRMAEATILTNDFEKSMLALEETKHLIQDHGDNNSAGLSAVSKLREIAKQNRKNSLAKQKKTFGGIFEKAAKDEKAMEEEQS